MRKSLEHRFIIIIIIIIIIIKCAISACSTSPQLLSTKKHARGSCSFGSTMDFQARKQLAKCTFAASARKLQLRATKVARDACLRSSGWKTKRLLARSVVRDARFHSAQVDQRKCVCNVQSASQSVQVTYSSHSIYKSLCARHSAEVTLWRFFCAMSHCAISCFAQIALRE